MQPLVSLKVSARFQQSDHKVGTHHLTSAAVSAQMRDDVYYDDGTERLAQVHTPAHTHTHTKWAMIRKPGRGRGKKGTLNVKKQTMRKG